MATKPTKPAEEKAVVPKAPLTLTEKLAEREKAKASTQKPKATSTLGAPFKG